MSEAELDRLLDDFVFEPNGWDFAVTIGLRVDPESDRAALGELADAMLVWAPKPVIERLVGPALDALWDDELAHQIRDGIVELTTAPDWEKAAASALAEFDRDPREAAVSREVVCHLAMQLGSADHPVFFCLDCLDESLRKAGPDRRRELARRAVVVARRNAAVPDDELHEALAGVTSSSPIVRLGTVERRQAVRARLGRLGELGRDSMPTLATALRALAAESLPARPEDDDVWVDACAMILADIARPERN